LENFDFFSELNEELVNNIKSNSKYVEIPKGTILFYEGDICKEVLYLIEGNIKL
jgi:CRP/FNR family transcriptional regulator